ncbi:MAG TPA: hypothetical protein VEL47_07530, partial [Myxococcota bacterium]|nr:hypothetical protein [Myxococcota bacterium]
MKLSFFKKKAKAKEPRGVAILMVMVSLAMLMALVTELSSKELVRYKLALNERDALQADALAESGANFAQIILTVQEPLQAYMVNFAKLGISLPEYTIWKLFPIASPFLKAVTDGSVVPDFDVLSGKKENEEPKNPSSDSENKTKEVSLVGPYETPEGGFGAFPGQFSVNIVDEESKISVRKWTRLPFPQRKMIAEEIFHILSKKEYEPFFERGAGKQRNIRPSQLIGNMYDYISDEERAVDVSAPSESFGRDFIGDKRSQYFDSPGILPKRALMDSIAELRLVPGMNDAIYQVLSKTVTVYGESEAINILSASDEVLGAAFYLCTKSRESSSFQRQGFEAELLADWHRKKDESKLELSAEGVMKFLEENGIDVDKQECGKTIGTESKNFTVMSTATVGRVSRTVLLRLRSAGGLI